jgi:putative tryptophan/tyrosine transport system substrate-binding protein
MRRRNFLSLLGGAAAGWPLGARAQQLAKQVVGFLHAGSPEPNAKRLAAFRGGLSETGYFEKQNLTIEFRWANGQPDRLPELAADLIRRQVAVIATPVSTEAALAAKAATGSIPIIFAVGGDPVALGLVASLNRPGGNATGINLQNVDLTAKRFELLHELVPKGARFAALVNSNFPYVEAIVKDLQTGAAILGLEVEILHAGNDREIDASFAKLSKRPDSALMLPPDSFFFSRRAQIVTLAARHALPVIYPTSEYPVAGGLISYGPDIAHACQQTGVYTGRILKGENPANLPVMQPTKFELVVNLQTARLLGITVPPTLLALADDVVE